MLNCFSWIQSPIKIYCTYKLKLDGILLTFSLQITFYGKTKTVIAVYLSL